MSRTSDRAAILQRVALAIDTIVDQRQQSNLAAATSILAGLVLEKGIIQRLMRRDLMQESVIYQELREEARAEVRRELREEAQLEVGRSLILRQLGRRVGALPDAARSHIEALSLTQLESLGEALLDFSSLFDLETWLANHPAA